jgi:outer membrane protein OmpA-like peptidoglycan-associated protein
MDRKMFIAGLATGFIIGCASTAPSELVSARSAYRRAADGPAGTYAKSELQVAEQSLERAERSYTKNGDDERTRDLAYIANRQAELAAVRGQLAVAQSDRDVARRDLDIAMNERRKAAEDRLAENQKALGRTMDQVAQDKKSISEEQRKLGEEQQRIGDEKQRLSAQEQALNEQRVQQETRERETRAALEKLGDVKEEKRGIVLNISGAVLFSAGKSTLLPTAKTKLSELAEAINSMDSDQKIVIEGHTDATGSDDTNQRLSLARATAVKTFLMKKGVEAKRLEAVGMGEADPVADNTTVEGRAENRRVEIVVEKAT